MEYVNRKGDKYYIFQGKTKTGKPKYFASKSDTSEKGVQVGSLPEEFEVHENPANATVTVRRRKPSRVLASERDLVARLAKERSAYSCVQTVIDADRIVVYTPDSDPNEAPAAIGRILGSFPSRAVEWIQGHTQYSAELRFTIHDVDQRTYIAERYCYRSAFDGWIQVGGPMPLRPLAEDLVSHLGKESFYELF